MQGVLAQRGKRPRQCRISRNPAPNALRFWKLYSMLCHYWLTARPRFSSTTATPSVRRLMEDDDG